MGYDVVRRGNKGIYIRSFELPSKRRRDAPFVAGEYGFEHLSYLARDYRALFGESPSETLRRRA